MARDELTEDVKRAVAIARQAMEIDAAEARKRGWGIPAPDSASVAALAAGILVADAIGTANQPVAEAPAASRSVPRRRTSRTAAGAASNISARSAG
jgi:hypothetical protein